MHIELIADIGEVEADAWDALVGDSDPFVEHRFLKALEDSGSVGAGTGWHPAHVTVWDGPALVAALPLYAKGHSYGEYIFDWGWASAAERAGIAYYPKLVSMVPFTPVTGRRFLFRSDQTLQSVVEPLLSGAFAAADKLNASSLHLLFLSDEERKEATRDPRLRPRLSMQYHWQNDGYGCFDDYVARFRSSLRKQVRKERKRAQGAGLEIRTLHGPELSNADWRALSAFYFDTCHKRGSGPYLTDGFFDRLRGSDAARVLAVLACDGDHPVAGTLNFVKGDRLYGRYWGCTQEYDALHFECCYYRLIEYAIEHGIQHFEAGAQGTHKLRRGLMPAAIHSAHWVAHAGLREAVVDFLPREAASVQQEMAELAAHGPFKRDTEGA